MVACPYTIHVGWDLITLIIARGERGERKPGEISCQAQLTDKNRMLQSKDDLEPKAYEGE